MKLRALEPFVGMENIQQQFHFKLTCECTWHNLYIQCKMHTCFSIGKSWRTDDSTEHLKAIFRSRNLMIYNLNEQSKIFFLQETNTFGISILCQKKISLTEENAALFIPMKRQIMPYRTRGWVSLAMFYTICPLTPQF